MIPEFFTSISSLLLALTISATPGVAIDRACFPAIPAKPNTEVTASLGKMMITPEISEVNKDNKITVAVTPNADARSIIINPEAGFSKESLLDWGPKNLPARAVFRYE